MEEISITGLSGGLSSPLRTLSLVRLAAARIADAVAGAGVDIRIVGVASLPGLGAIRGRDDAGPGEEAALLAVERADLLVVGSPVSKGRIGACSSMSSASSIIADWTAFP